MSAGSEPPSKPRGTVEDLGVALATLGLVALWWLPGGDYGWAALIGLPAILILTWRIWGVALALGAMAATLHAATWHHEHDLLPSTAIDAVRDLAGMLWLSLDEGPLSWLLATMLSTVLPFFILGGVLANRTFLGSPVGLECEGASLSGTLVAAVHAVARFLLPTVAVGVLLMTVRPGVSLTTTATASLLPLSVYLVWSWLMPTREAATTAST
ncbi:MAG: hypothetical protein OEU92_35250, partial [Alphaproteobacteria bacterium]|nr:hypothetical protein [Alphaproteobacteria bacterium]